MKFAVYGNSKFEERLSALIDEYVEEQIVALGLRKKKKTTTQLGKGMSEFVAFVDQLFYYNFVTEEVERCKMVSPHDVVYFKNRKCMVVGPEPRTGGTAVRLVLITNNVDDCIEIEI